MELHNNLGQETSPYLLQHRDNPVHWQPWGPAALLRAKREDKPILLSVGYAACHWCHVMAHESFEDDDIAALMNDLYVSIKVDREERPDIDQIYQGALALLGQSGGWPLTMFLTPDAEPFWGGTYFPPTARWGRAGFPDVLRGVHQAYRETPEKVDSNRRALTAALADLARKGAPQAIDADTIAGAASALLRAVDMAHGGFGDAPKFPQASGHLLLWRAHLRTGNRQFGLAVTLSAERMSRGGIYDHVGGGFARYAVDERWLVPHFEKMLYDNAALVGLLTELWRETGAALYAERVAETIGWCLREMRVGDGFASSLDADSEHEEGKFYVWTEAEIDAALGVDSEVFKAHYDVLADGNWEGKTILNRSRVPMADAVTEALLARGRTKLLGLRAGRVRPGRDDKVLADWNGLMIAAMAEAAFAFDRADWLAHAEAAFAFVVANMMGDDGRLHHSFRDGRRTPMAVLDDYADMAAAALRLHEVTGHGAYLARAQGWAAIADAHYADPAGGYFLTADDAETLITRTKSAIDSPVPSGNGMMAEVQTRLYHLTGEAAYRARAEATIAAFGEEARRNVYGLPTLINSAELLLRAVQIVIVGKGADALIHAVAGVSLPNRVLTVLAPGTALPANHPAAGKGPVGGQATAYVCVGETCSLPLSVAGELGEALRAARRS
ncbi:MAG: thioredoxin domain-containing protein [Alphaproteobacteria bacterium]|nr:thioredoxin domain-containing protein [Alphaproteobacteria bacterium]